MQHSSLLNYIFHAVYNTFCTKPLMICTDTTVTLSGRGERARAIDANANIWLPGSYQRGGAGGGRGGTSRANTGVEPPQFIAHHRPQVGCHDDEMCLRTKGITLILHIIRLVVLPTNIAAGIVNIQYTYGILTAKKCMRKSRIVFNRLRYIVNQI